MEINTEQIIEKKEELENYNDYLPFIIQYHIETGKYYNNIKNNQKIIKKINQKRTEFLKSNNWNNYLKKDLQKWIKQNKKYETIIKKQ